MEFSWFTSDPNKSGHKLAFHTVFTKLLKWTFSSNGNKFVNCSRVSTLSLSWFNCIQPLYGDPLNYASLRLLNELCNHISILPHHVIQHVNKMQRRTIKNIDHMDIFTDERLFFISSGTSCTIEKIWTFFFFGIFHFVCWKRFLGKFTVLNK